jgi:hypothetical protein
MQMKRVIPKVGAAALTLGGGVAAAGCSSDAVNAYCNHIADCYGYGSAYVRNCRDYHDDLLYAASYYSSRCERSIRRLLRCETSLSCRQLRDAYYYCADEYDDVDFYCGWWWW